LIRRGDEDQNAIDAAYRGIGRTRSRAVLLASAWIAPSDSKDAPSGTSTRHECASNRVDQALDAIERDHAFLLLGSDVFTCDVNLARRHPSAFPSPRVSSLLHHLAPKPARRRARGPSDFGISMGVRPGLTRTCDQPCRREDSSCLKRWSIDACPCAMLARGSGSFSTDPVGPACHLMSAPVRKRPKCCIAAKCREGPTGDIARWSEMKEAAN